MTSWTKQELDQIGAAEELDIAPPRADGRPGKPVPIWVVRVDDDLYVRSYRGPGAHWYRRAQEQGQAHVRAGGVEKDIALAEADPQRNDQVDQAYRTKYARYPSYVTPMLAAQARATTSRLVPR